MRTPRSFLVAATVTCGLAATAGAAAGTAGAVVQNSQSGWAWGNPQPQGNTIRAMDFAPGRTFAVGDSGTGLRSDDGGRTWVGMSTGTSAGLSRVQALTPDIVIVLGGDGCVLRRSDDGGRTFRKLYILAEADCPDRVQIAHFVDPQTGYLVLRDGTVLKTTDGGQTFGRTQTAVPETRQRGGGATPSDAIFTGPDTGVVFLENDPRGFRTTDGGTSWQRVEADPGNVRRIERVDDTTIYAIGPDTLLRSTDQGVTWRKRPGVAFEDLTSIKCASPSLCLMTVARGDYLLRTEDAGETAPQRINTTQGVFAAGFATADPRGRRRAGRRDGDLRRRGPHVRAGRRRHRRLVPVRPASRPDARRGLRPRRAEATSPARPTAARPGGSSGSRRRPTSRTSASRRPTRATSSTSAAACSARPTAARAGRRSTPARAAARPSSPSNRTSSSWQGPGSAAQVGNLQFEQVRSRVLRGGMTSLDRAGGSVVAFGASSAAVSRDDGASWTKLRLPTRQVGKRREVIPVLDLDFIDSLHGFVLDVAGRVWWTPNAGRVWAERAATGTPLVRSLAMTDALTGLATVNAPFGNVFGDYVLRTTDGGVTWRPQRISSGSFPAAQSVVAADATRAYAVTSTPAVDENTFRSLFATSTGGDAGSATSLLAHDDTPDPDQAPAPAGRLPGDGERSAAGRAGRRADRRGHAAPEHGELDDRRPSWRARTTARSPRRCATSAAASTSWPSGPAIRAGRGRAPASCGSRSGSRKGDERPLGRGLRGQRPGGHLAPQPLEAVELARLGREDVHDDVEVVHEDPARLGHALDPPRQEAVLLLHPLVDADRGSPSSGGRCCRWQTRKKSV